MKKIEVDLIKEISELFPKILHKDLTEHERICPTCHGLGMRIDDNVYGLSEERNIQSMFPYKHQALSFCRDCYNGVQRLCKYCGKPYKNQAYLHCDCDGQKEADRLKEIEDFNNKTKNAIEVIESDRTEMLYCEEFDEYYETVEDFFEYYYNEDNIDIKSTKLWVCSKEVISIDASNVIEDACNELHEDASDNCDYKGLQKLLDKWCEEQSGTTTYCPCYKEYVSIDWSKY